MSSEATASSGCSGLPPPRQATTGPAPDPLRHDSGAEHRHRCAAHAHDSRCGIGGRRRHRQRTEDGFGRQPAPCRHHSEGRPATFRRHRPSGNPCAGPSGACCSPSASNDFAGERRGAAGNVFPGRNEIRMGTMNERTTVVIQGVESAGAVPGIESDRARCGASVRERFRLAARSAARCRSRSGMELPGRRHCARLRPCGPAAGGFSGGAPGWTLPLFPALVESDVTLTNVRGVFDQPMAEYTLGMILGFAKDFRGSYDRQRERKWSSPPERADCGRPGRWWSAPAASDGRSPRTLRAAGIEVEGVGRTARDGDPDFGRGSRQRESRPRPSHPRTGWS